MDELEVHVIAALREEHVDAFVVGLGADFYVDADMIRDAIRHRSEFNVIYTPAIFKVDVFVPRLDLIARRELARPRPWPSAIRACESSRPRTSSRRSSTGIGSATT